MTRPSLFECFRLAVEEERGKLIVAMYEMPIRDLERLVEAAQLIDSEGVQIGEERDYAADLAEEEEAVNA